MRFPRSSGVLLHPTSLPGPFGIGDLGPEAYRFADWLEEAGQRLWQVLPLGPTGYGDSPYQSFSSFAGNPLLVSPERLRDDGWLKDGDLEERPSFDRERVDYGAVIGWKHALLDTACDRFERGASAEAREEFDRFQREEAAWLDDFALFMALKEARGGGVWTEWPKPLAQREPDALEQARGEFAEAIDRRKFAQWQFFRQWRALKAHCGAQGLSIVGDLPIYVAHDSADVWANAELFRLDEQGRPEVVAGVPPDYFSRTGQLWGNPIYKWHLMAERGYAWWVERVRATLALVDIVRLDHFRGFEAYWEVPADHKTAEHGRWADGPGAGFFETLRDRLGGELPLIAENLGVITDQVEALREQFALPGMAVFQFSFGPDATTSAFPPHKHTDDLVVYTGTHDNDTTRGWWEGMPGDDPVRQYVTQYLAADRSDEPFHEQAIRAWMASPGATFIVPVQDLLGLGSESRMNTPGQPAGNWQWRLPPGALAAEHAARLAALTRIYDRLAPR